MRERFGKSDYSLKMCHVANITLTNFNPYISSFCTVLERLLRSCPALQERASAGSSLARLRSRKTAHEQTAFSSLLVVAWEILSGDIAMATSQLTGLACPTRLQKHKSCYQLCSQSSSFRPSQNTHAKISFSSSAHISFSRLLRQRAAIGSHCASCRPRHGTRFRQGAPIPLARAASEEPGISETDSEQDAEKGQAQQHSIVAWLLQAVISSLPSSLVDALPRYLDSLPPSVRDFPWPLVSKAVLDSQVSLLLPAASVALLPALLLCSLGEIAYAVQAERAGWAVLVLGLAVAACHWAWGRSFAWAKAHGYAPQTNKTPAGVLVSDCVSCRVMCKVHAGYATACLTLSYPFLLRSRGTL